MSHTTSRFIAFFDECGDHSMEKIDPIFPLFVLSTVIFDREIYAKHTIPAVAKLKMQFWNHEGINLHSRDIRRAQDDFLFMQNPINRLLFVDSLSAMMSELKFTLFIAVIDKAKHFEIYGAEAMSPYDLSMCYTFEKIAHFLENNNENVLPIIAESRGRKEDDELRESFGHLMTSPLFKNSHFPITFRRKRDNVAGMQLADLCAYPAARKILDPNKINPAFEIISSKLYNNGNIAGLKISP
jgi:hypothetical protein